MLREINLISGPFPLFLALIASITVLVKLGRHPRLRPVAAVIAASALVIGVARMLLPGSVDVARIPHSSYVWAAVPLVAAGITAISWRPSSRSRRLAGLLAIPLTIAFAADQVDAWFAYVRRPPTSPARRCPTRSPGRRPARPAITVSWCVSTSPPPPPASATAGRSSGCHSRHRARRHRPSPS